MILSHLDREPLHFAWSIALYQSLASGHLIFGASIIQCPLCDLFQLFSTLVVWQDPLVIVFGQFVLNRAI